MRSVFFLLLAAALLLSPNRALSQETEAPSAFDLNLAHLEHLTQEIATDSAAYRIVHIYAEAPDYEWVDDEDEGIACVDDAARAAVLYLRLFEQTGEAEMRERAAGLLRFVMYMQAESGLFYNFVWNDELKINRAHPNSRADRFEWWAARAVWALGTAARALKDADPELAEEAAQSARRTFPYLEEMLSRYGETAEQNGRTVPQWLVYESGADATSELLLGLVALHEVEPDAALQEMINRFAEGIARMRYGAPGRFPYGLHASFEGLWHGWGNAQTEALAAAGLHLESARAEAEAFYPRLLIDGWLHSITFDPKSIRRFEQTPYAVRGVAVGLIRLYEATGETRYATMAGLAASWLTGNNAAEAAMYDPATGRGYDGIDGPGDVNRNAGAESTIEALLTIFEMSRRPEVRRWLFARGGPARTLLRGGLRYRLRVFTAADSDGRLALALDVTTPRLLLLEGDALDAFLEAR